MTIRSKKRSTLKTQMVKSPFDVRPIRAQCPRKVSIAQIWFLSSYSVAPSEQLGRRRQPVQHQQLRQGEQRVAEFAWTCQSY